MKEYRATFDPQFQGDAGPFISDPVGSQELAEGQLALIANYTLHLHENSLMSDWSNYGFIECREDGGEWIVLDEDDL